jgi:hypothetical protein
MKLGQDAKQAICQAMAGLSGAEATAMAQSLAQQFEVSIPRIYALSQAVRPKRQRRSDAGQMRGMSEETFERLAAYTVQAGMDGQRLMEIAEANGLGKIAPQTYNRYLRSRGLSRRQIARNVRPYRPWEAPASNVLHQVDSTQAETFYVNADGSIGYEPEARRYKNKRGNQRPRLHLVSVVDDYSRVCFAQFVTGNAAPQWLRVLHAAWSPKDDPLFPFFGIPEEIYVDNDAVIKSSMFRKAMEALGVHVRKTSVDNPRAKGKVERPFRWLNDYQNILRFTSFATVDDLNADLYDYLIGKNNRIHATTQQKPFMRWIAGIDQARRPPSAEHLERLTLDSRQAKIYADMTIRVNGRIWLLPRHVDLVDLATREEKIEVCWYRDDPEQVIVSTGDKEWVLDAAKSRPEPDTAGQFKALPKAPTIARQEALKAVDLRKEPLKVSGFYAQRHGVPYLVRPDRVEAPAMPAIPKRVLLRTQLTQRLQRDGIIPRALHPERDAAIVAFLNRRYAAGDVYESDIDAIIQEIQALSARQETA